MKSESTQQIRLVYLYFSGRKRSILVFASSNHMSALFWFRPAQEVLNISEEFLSMSHQRAKKTNKPGSVYCVYSHASTTAQAERGGCLRHLIISYADEGF